MSAQDELWSGHKNIWEIWLIIAILCAATVAVLLRGPRHPAPAGDREPHLAVYKAQLAELDRDAARGVVNAGEAEAQKAEIARRLLAASKTVESKPAPHNRMIYALAVLLVPVLALGLYGQFGTPRLPDMPQADRLANAEKAGDLEAMVYKVERHLAEKPDDVQGWMLLLPIYQSMGRYRSMALAYENLIRIQGSSADLQAGLAEALTLGNGGVLTPDAAKAAAAALTLDPKSPKARYYAALSEAQDGDKDKALADFRALLADSPADAPWRQSVLLRIKEMEEQGSRVAAPSEEQAAAVLEQTGGDQQAMIRSMVDGLAAKLEADPKDLDGWLRLIRARTVLQETKVAEAALAKARVAFSGDQPALERLAALAQELKLK